MDVIEEGGVEEDDDDDNENVRPAKHREKWRHQNGIKKTRSGTHSSVSINASHDTNAEDD